MSSPAHLGICRQGAQLVCRCAVLVLLPGAPASVHGAGPGLLRSKMASQFVLEHSPRMFSALHGVLLTGVVAQKGEDKF